MACAQTESAASNSYTAGPLKIGDSRARVLEYLGKPQAEMAMGNKRILYYGKHVVEMVNGRVVYIDPGILEAARHWKENAAYAAEQQAKATPPPPPTPAPEAKPDEKALPGKGTGGGSIAVISQGGKYVDLNTILVTGKITIVEFYADWCGPCSVLGPKLEALVKNDSELCLRKIDIVNWRSEVAKQYQITSVPNVRVFDRNGQLQGHPTASLVDVQQYITQVK